jgi:cytochrome c peroxidase
MGKFKVKAVSKVICVAVNDPFVMANWGKDTGATESGIDMLCDPSSAFITEIGLNFDAEPIGFFNRSKRFSMIIKNKRIEVLNVDEDSGTCDLSAGETLLNLL